jgi:hypothetical protein
MKNTSEKQIPNVFYLPKNDPSEKMMFSRAFTY